MSKTAFYYRTQEEFNKVFYFAEEVSKHTRDKFKIKRVIRAESRYLGDPQADSVPSCVPYSTPTKKKYIGVLYGNAHNLERAGVDPVKILEELKVARVQHSDSHPKYTGATSEKNTFIKGYKQFNKLVSVFNKQFGHGNWKIHGPKKLQEKLKAIDDTKRDWGDGARLRKNYPKGIPVKVVVKAGGVDIKKHLFKLALMA